MGKPIPKDTRRLITMNEEIDTALQENPMLEEACTASGFSPADIQDFVYKYLEQKARANIGEINRVLDIFAMLDEHNIIDETAITFEVNANIRAIATAFLRDKRIGFYTNKIIDKNINNTYIHELAHHVAYRQLGLANHCLEFAIINYCMRKKYKGGLTFFNSYDIHEDEAYRFLCINPSEFDSLISCIKFDSFGELSRKASKLAKKIRQKSVPMDLSILEDEQ
jgi:hypothetical protein